MTGPALWHGAVNMGEFSRIHLVMDVAGQQNMPQPLEVPEVEDELVEG
jgi:hypothetical protein